MGIDVYLRWRNQTSDEHNAQMTGFSLISGNVGYLREAYHGGPYATRVLVPEAFDENTSCSEHGDDWDICAEHDNEMYSAKTNFGFHPDGSKCECRMLGAKISAETIAGRIEATAGTVIERFKKVYNEDIDQNSPYVKAYLDFAKLAIEKQAEGKEIFVRASW